MKNITNTSNKSNDTITAQYTALVFDDETNEIVSMDFGGYKTEKDLRIFLESICFKVHKIITL